QEIEDRLLLPASPLFVEQATVNEAWLRRLPSADRSASRLVPASNPDAVPLALSSRVTNPRGRLHRVLLVDDDADVRSFCKAILQSDDLLCDEADGGEAALTAVHAGTYDLVVLDVNMPGLTGPEVCRLLRELPFCANMKVLIVSGEVNPDVMAQLLL